MGLQQVGQPRADLLPDFGSVDRQSRIETDREDICRRLQHLVAADASGLFHNCGDRR